MAPDYVYDADVIESAHDERPALIGDSDGSRNEFATYDPVRAST